MKGIAMRIYELPKDKVTYNYRYFLPYAPEWGSEEFCNQWEKGAEWAKGSGQKGLTLFIIQISGQKGLTLFIIQILLYA
jgi:hypothetical protein